MLHLMVEYSETVEYKRLTFVMITKKYSNEMHRFIDEFHLDIILYICQL